MKKKRNCKIVKYYEGDEIPIEGNFLYAEKEFVRMIGWISNLKPYYKNVFYYEVTIGQHK